MIFLVNNYIKETPVKMALENLRQKSKITDYKENFEQSYFVYLKGCEDPEVIHQLLEEELGNGKFKGFVVSNQNISGFAPTALWQWIKVNKENEKLPNNQG